MFTWRTMRIPCERVAGVTPQRQMVPPGQSMACCTGLVFMMLGWVMVGAHPLYDRGLLVRHDRIMIPE